MGEIDPTTEAIEAFNQVDGLSATESQVMRSGVVVMVEDESQFGHVFRVAREQGLEKHTASRTSDALEYPDASAWYKVSE